MGDGEVKPMFKNTTEFVKAYVNGIKFTKKIHLMSIKTAEMVKWGISYLNVNYSKEVLILNVACN